MTAEPGALHVTVTGWPWRPGNEFRLLDGGAEFFPRMLTAIETARSHVLLEMYLVSSGRVAARAATAASSRMRVWSCASSIRCTGATGCATSGATTASSSA
jgi:phosphatidylserine/phosphatidylglycerophosphate/cardiolipin synthase-like enzyme